MRWIWIDRFLKFERGKKACAVKNLSLAEDYFDQHLPGYPIMPACFILEGLAQTGGILVGEANDFKEKVVLAKITSARFVREVVAGETLIYETEMLTLRPEGASIVGKVYAVPPGIVPTEPSGTPSPRQRSSSPTWTSRDRNNCSAITTSSSAGNSSTCWGWPKYRPSARTVPFDSLRSHISRFARMVRAGKPRG